MKKDEKLELGNSIQRESNKNKLMFVGAAVTLVASNAMAGGGTGTGTGTGVDDSFGDLFTVFDDWLSGNLGKLLALIGFAGTFLVYMMTHKGSVLFIGVIISLIAGGIVGISETFFDAGSDAFN